MRYRLSHRTSLKLGGVLYHPGDEFEAEPGTVARLVACGTLVDASCVTEDVASEAEDGPSREEQIHDAIAELDPGNSSHFTSSGLPRVEAIESTTGLDITAEERDAVWELMQ